MLDDVDVVHNAGGGTRGLEVINSCIEVPTNLT